MRGEVGGGSERIVRPSPLTHHHTHHHQHPAHHHHTTQQTKQPPQNKSIHNADVHLGEDYEVDDLVDVIEGSRVYVPAIYVVNKIDAITLEELELMDRLPHYCPVSELGVVVVG